MPGFLKNLSTDMWFGFGFDIVVISAPAAVDLARRRRGEEVMDGATLSPPGIMQKTKSDIAVVRNSFVRA